LIPLLANLTISFCILRALFLLLFVLRVFLSSAILDARPSALLSSFNSCFFSNKSTFCFITLYTLSDKLKICESTYSNFFFRRIMLFFFAILVGFNSVVKRKDPLSIFKSFKFSELKYFLLDECFFTVQGNLEGMLNVRCRLTPVISHQDN